MLLNAPPGPQTERVSRLQPFLQLGDGPARTWCFVGFAGGRVLLKAFKNISLKTKSRSRRVLHAWRHVRT